MRVVKILCLIIDSIPHAEWQETYDAHRCRWNRCLDLCPEVDGYFVQSNPDLAVSYLRTDRTFTVRDREYIDTITYKTLRAISVLLADHTHVVRTNLSSIFDFRLLPRLGLPQEHLYAGHVIRGGFVSGAGMILSRDVAEKLLRPVALPSLAYQDDVVIGQLLSVHRIVPQHIPMFSYDYQRGRDQLVVGRHAHYRMREEGDPYRTAERSAADYVFSKVYEA